jgi:hypothetical protein
VPRVSAPPAVFSCRLLLGLRLELPTFVVDDNETKPRSLQEPREVCYACKARIAFSRHDNVVRRRGPERHLTLA